MDHSFFARHSLFMVRMNALPSIFRQLRPSQVLDIHDHRAVRLYLAYRRLRSWVVTAASITDWTDWTLTFHTGRVGLTGYWACRMDRLDDKVDWRRSKRACNTVGDEQYSMRWQILISVQCYHTGFDRTLHTMMTLYK